MWYKVTSPVAGLGIDGTWGVKIVWYQHDRIDIVDLTTCLISSTFIQMALNLKRNPELRMGISFPSSRRTEPCSMTLGSSVCPLTFPRYVGWSEAYEKAFAANSQPCSAGRSPIPRRTVVWLSLFKEIVVLMLPLPIFFFALVFIP